MKKYYAVVTTKDELITVHFSAESHSKAELKASKLTQALEGSICVVRCINNIAGTLEHVATIEGKKSLLQKTSKKEWWATTLLLLALVAAPIVYFCL